MRVRDLERMLAEHGVGAAKVDAITRRLRDRGRLPIGGRGPNAPHIGPAEASAILLAVAGSSKGAEADLRLEKLEGLGCISAANNGVSLGEAVCELLRDPGGLTGLREVRVARTRTAATILFRDGKADEYARRRPQGESERFYVEGVLPAALLRKIAAALTEAPTAPARSEELG